MSRKKNFCQDRLPSLVSLFKEERVTHLVVTGDLSTTSHPKEFGLAQEFLSEVENRGILVHALPGNHDNYTRKAFAERTFYKFFDTPLKDKGVHVKSLAPHWWLITLDTTLATSLISSHGFFSEEIEAALEEELAQIPQGDKVILANHFPFFEHESPRKSLKRAEALRALILRSPKIVFYLHGHTHAHCIADLRGSGFPIILDCGSTPHRTTGAFHLIEIEKSRYTIKVYRWDSDWQLDQEASFHV